MKKKNNITNDHLKQTLLDGVVVGMTKKSIASMSDKEYANNLYAAATLVNKITNDIEKKDK